MKNLDVAKEYSLDVLKHFDDLIPILYGSSVFGINGHDLDMCFASDKVMTKEEIEELIRMTRFYHHKYHLIVDEEVPYTNKLVYPKDFIFETLNNGPFPIIDGRYQIPPIVKSREFLSSLEMRKRLLINILTTKHLVLSDKKDEIEEYAKLACEYMIRVLTSYANLERFTKDDLYEVFIKDPYANLDGEFYLGYKTNFPERIAFLKAEINDGLTRMVENEELMVDSTKHYVKKR